MRKIELLAPAKSRESAFAAIDHGADAIYIGGAKFGARHAAGNSTEDIARVVEYAHRFGVRVHSTLNTLLFDNELKDAEAQARELISTGIDALIVQDMALARMGLPIELHASTQMCNTSPEGVRFLEECGFSRVVLERALSLEQIKAIGAATNIEIEAFVHGAICVSHSGRCFMSRSMSNRSGNRGECSQPCRMTYDLLDDTGAKLMSNKHLLSVRDLNLSRRVGEMIDAGVSSFKIEGRLKEIGYTKNIVSYYRSAIDSALAEREGYCRSSQGESQIEFTPNPNKSFTRGESEYLFDGQRTELASFETPKAVGEKIGRVEEVRGDSIRIKSSAPLTAGDGLCSITENGLVGGSVNVVGGDWVKLSRTDGFERGATLFRNFDKSFADKLESSRTRRSIATTAQIKITHDIIEVSYTDCDGHTATAQREGIFEEAKNLEKMAEVIRTQLSKSGDTIFRVESVAIDGNGFAPSSMLADIRREALQRLLDERVAALEPIKIFKENLSARYPLEELTEENNVTNTMAEEFYRDHGATKIVRGWDLATDLSGARVMQSSYCIRREIGQCLRENPTLKSDLFIEHGTFRYRLEFDCKRCQMNIFAL